MRSAEADVMPAATLGAVALFAINSEMIRG